MGRIDHGCLKENCPGPQRSYADSRHPHQTSDSTRLPSCGRSHLSVIAHMLWEMGRFCLLRHVGHTEGSISPDFRCVSSEGLGEEAARTMETSSCNTPYSHPSDGVVEAQRGLVTCSKSCSKMAAARIQIQAPLPEVSYTPGKPSHCPDTSGHWVLVEESRRRAISVY